VPTTPYDNQIVLRSKGDPTSFARSVRTWRRMWPISWQSGRSRATQST